MIRKLLIITVVAMISLSSYSQESRTGYLLSNNNTSFPVLGYPQLFYSQLHPGIDLYHEWKMNKSEKSQLWYSFNLGGFYHRFIQTTVKLFPKIEYKYFVNDKIDLQIGLGAGYLHTFDNVKVMKLNSEGEYDVQSTLKGRPQFMFTLDMGFGYKLKNDFQLVMLFRTIMHGPFIKNYVPLVPYNSLAVGLNIPLTKKSTENE